MLRFPRVFQLPSAGSTPCCDFCLERYAHFVDDNCIPIPRMPPGEGHYVCKKCYDEARKFIKNIESMDPKKLPLYISHDNLIIRNKAIKALEAV
jgi:hypothetical protein